MLALMRRLACVLIFVAGCVGSAPTTGDGSDGSDGGATEDLAVTTMPGDDLAGVATPTPDLALPATPPFVYVSGYSTTIGRYTLDPATGALTSKGTTTTTGSPSFLAIDPARKHLYAVDESGSKVQAFALDATTGALTHLGTDQGSGGSGPAHLTVDRSGKWVLAANYGSGDVGILKINADGSVAAPTSLQAGANAHEVVLDGANAHAWVPCLGMSANYVAQYAFDAGAGTLTAATPATVPAQAANAGPRHLALHPNGQFAYLVEETASMIDAYSVDAGGHLAFVQRQTNRAAGTTGTNTCAEVQVHPSGKWVYASNRGDDDIAVYAVATDGKLSPLAHTKTGGQQPRHFSLDPTGHWLLVANQMSGDVRVFAVDGATGLLAATTTKVTATMPSFVGVVPPP
jgi:6-phosphogluconolactonase